MGQLINKSYKHNKWLVWTSLTIFLLIFAFIFTSHVLSQNDTSRSIKFNGKTWDIDKEPKPEWYTNQNDTVTFSVDLKEDYQNYLSSLEKPKEDETVEPAPVPADVEQPFTVAASYDGKAANTIKVSKVLDAAAVFHGEYKVEITLPAKSDSGLDVTVDFAENTWGFTAKPAAFRIERDTVKPKISLSGINQSIYTENDGLVVLNLEVEEKNFSQKDVSVLVVLDEEGEGKPVEINWDKENERLGHMEFPQSGKYDVTAFLRDKAGNESDKDHVSFTINKDEPKMSGFESKGFYHDDVTIKFEDDGRIMKAQANLVRTHNGERFDHVVDFTPKLFGYVKRTAYLTMSEEGHYEGTATITDNQGKEFTYPLSFTIDKNAPAITVLGVENQQKYNEKKTVEISITEDQQLNTEATEMMMMKKSIGGKTEAIPLTPNFSADSKTASFKQGFEDGLYELTISTSDIAGNMANQKVRFTIDSQKPELEVTVGGKALLDKQVVDNGSFSVKAADLTLDLSKTVLTLNQKNTALQLDESRTIATLKQETTLADGDYELSFSSIDGLEHSQSIGPLAFVVDTKAPEVSLTGIEPAAFVKNGTLTIEVKEKNYHTNHVSYKVEKRDGYGHYTDFADDRFAKWGNTGETSTIALPFGNSETTDNSYDGQYRVTVTVKDAAGHEVVKTVEFTIDSTAPVVNTDLSADFNGSHYGQKGTISIIVNEPQVNFDTKDVFIAVRKKNGEDYVPVDSVAGTWTQSPASSVYTILFAQEDQNEGDYQIIIDAKDKAGNAAEQKSILFTIDHTVPVVSIDPVFADKRYFNKNTDFHFKISDTNLQLTGNDLAVSKDGSIFSKAGQLELLAGTKDTGVGAYTFTEDGDYSVTLASSDKAGNVSVQEKREFILDKTPPRLTITGVDTSAGNYRYYPEGKQVSIAVEDRNFSARDIELAVTKDGKAISLGEWKKVYEETKVNPYLLVKSQITKVMAEDGKYTISLGLTDKAGNRSVIPPFGFTIDQTKPTIDIKGVENNAYYNTDKQVDVTIKDKNLKQNTIKVTRDGSSYNAGSFQVSGETAALSHTFSKEGKYEVVVEAIDQAGNSFSRKVTFTIDKTKPVITPKIKGEKTVIQDGQFMNKIFTPQFVLDQPEDTIVSVTLNGGADIKNQIPIAATEMEYRYHVAAKDKAGNEAALDISFILDTTRPTLTIKGVWDHFFNKNVAPTVVYKDRYLDEGNSTVTLNGKPFQNGQKLENEQDYVLKANIIDQAKNIHARTVVFTIDKTAPVITVKLKEPINDQYFNKNIIPDFVIDENSEYDIISLTLDGEPYTVGTPIETEGKHVLFLEVKDMAGNIKQMSVEFIIDKTKPNVVYEGVKRDKKYYEAVTVGIRLDHPEDTIKSITVNGEPFTGDAVTRNGAQVIKTTLKEIKPYQIKVVAADKAGNEIASTIPFEIVEKSALVKIYENKPLFAGTLASGLLLLTAGGVVLIRRRKVEEDK
ncbi:Ig-like domain-containing protein [Bacillus salipaludis]|uniref:Ig-like domain-containing protein n=1 Tax=Bacillus salipaludis TaxID=2547811 RepID=A0ABW8R9Y7_9BACI